MNSSAILYFLLCLPYYVFPNTIQSCSSKIYCQGDLLDTIQRARIFDDSKTFVDMSQKFNPGVTLQHFKKFMKIHKNKPSSKNVEVFVEQNFENINELVKWAPPDYTKEPKFLNEINNTKIKNFATKIVEIWPSLGRKVNQFVKIHPAKHSLIYLPNGFIIPGGRFKEIYYWDTYWIIKGLLLSEMKETVRGILDNFISLVKRHGFVPNGSRVYYLNRSQPPLLSLMVGLYIDATQDLEWLNENIQFLEEEMAWFKTNRLVEVNEYHSLFRYACPSGTPRPESYCEDLETCKAFSADEKEKCYKNLKSGAESGWDFSSRWIYNNDGSVGTNLSQTDVFRTIPVDLNTFICKAFKEIASFYKLLNNNDKYEEWNQRYNEMKNVIEENLFDKEDGVWYDYDLELKKHRKNFYPSNLTPLWAGIFNENSDIANKIVQYLIKNNILDYAGGIPTSLLHSGQQWDYPNAWPPLQEIVILGLKNTKNKDAISLAKQLAERVLDSFILGLEKTGSMFEKYDASKIGSFGGGGEYVVQSGFGWTNGVGLSLVKEFYINSV